MRHLIPVSLMFALLASAVTARGDDAGVFSSLYGELLKKVKATDDKADDLALAKRMIAAASANAGKPDMVALLCESAYDLSASHEDGYALAEEAMGVLLAHGPASKAEVAAQRMLSVLAKQAGAGSEETREAAELRSFHLLLHLGDERMSAGKWKEAASYYGQAGIVISPSEVGETIARGRMKEATRRQRLDERVAGLKVKILKAPEVANELVDLLIVELNDPAAAEPYLDRVKDDRLKAVAALRLQPLESWKAIECLRFVEWALDREERADGGAKIALLVQARSALGWYLELKPAAAEREKAEGLLKMVTDALAATQLLDPRTAPGVVVFDFIDQFKLGKAASPSTHYKLARDLSGRWIHMHPLPHGENAATFQIDLPALDKGEKLLMHFAPRINPKSEDGVRLYVLADGKEMWDALVKTGNALPATIDLTPFAGKKTAITLRVHCVRSQGYDDSAWVEPVIKRVKPD